MEITVKELKKGMKFSKPLYCGNILVLGPFLSLSEEDIKLLNKLGAEKTATDGECLTADLLSEGVKEQVLKKGDTETVIKPGIDLSGMSPLKQYVKLNRYFVREYTKLIIELNKIFTDFLRRSRIDVKILNEINIKIVQLTKECPAFFYLPFLNYDKNFTYLHSIRPAY